MLNFSKYIFYPKNFAFTLAEILITIGVISVVVALTLTNLFNAYQKHQTETALKKFYADINNAIRMSIVDNGDPEGWVVAYDNYNADKTLDFLKISFYFLNHS